MCKRVQTAPEGQEGLKAPQAYRPVVSPLKEDAAPGGWSKKIKPGKGGRIQQDMFFFFWRSFRAYFYFVLTPGDTGTFSPLSSGLCSCGTYSAFAPLGLFNIPLMKNFSVKKEYLPELDLFPIQHFAYNRQHYKNLTKDFFQKSIFSRSNPREIPVFWKIMG